MRHLLILLITTQLFAQELVRTPQFPNSAYFRERFTASVPPRVELQPPLRLADFMVGDKLELSLRSYLDLVLANNTDIQIQRLSIEPQRNQITRLYGRFDPSVSMSFRSTRANNPTSDALAGAAVQSSLNQPFSFNYNQILETGTQYQVNFNASKSASNSAFQTFNPSIAGNFGFNFTQPLVRDRGGYVNRLNIMIARS